MPQGAGLYEQARALEARRNARMQGPAHAECTFVPRTNKRRPALPSSAPASPADREAEALAAAAAAELALANEAIDPSNPRAALPPPSLPPMLPLPLLPTAPGPTAVAPAAPAPAAAATASDRLYREAGDRTRRAAERVERERAALSFAPTLVARRPAAAAQGGGAEAQALPAHGQPAPPPLPPMLATPSAVAAASAAAVAAAAALRRPSSASTPAPAPAAIASPQKPSPSRGALAARRAADAELTFRPLIQPRSARLERSGDVAERLYALQQQQAAARKLAQQQQQQLQQQQQQAGPRQAPGPQAPQSPAKAGAVPTAGAEAAQTTPADASAGAAPQAAKAPARPDDAPAPASPARSLNRPMAPAPPALIGGPPQPGFAQREHPQRAARFELLYAKARAAALEREAARLEGARRELQACTFAPDTSASRASARLVGVGAPVGAALRGAVLGGGAPAAGGSAAPGGASELSLRLGAGTGAGSPGERLFEEASRRAERRRRAAEAASRAEADALRGLFSPATNGDRPRPTAGQTPLQGAAAPLPGARQERLYADGLARMLERRRLPDELPLRPDDAEECTFAPAVSAAPLAAPSPGADAPKPSGVFLRLSRDAVLRAQAQYEAEVGGGAAGRATHGSPAQVAVFTGPASAVRVAAAEAPAIAAAATPAA